MSIPGARVAKGPTTAGRTILRSGVNVLFGRWHFVARVLMASVTDRNRHFSGCALSGKEKPGFLVLRRRSGSTARPVTIRKYVAPTEEAGFVPGDHR
jgi:hypothetical protein